MNKKSECCGCSACFTVCPVGAVKMQEDEEGFLYPVIDREKCINCGSCDDICNFKKALNEYKGTILKCYGARLKDRDILEKSSSGGVFTALSDIFIESGNMVLCSAYDIFLHEIRFRLIYNKDDRNSARGSVYLQSTVGKIWNEAFEVLKNHSEKKLLFIGTGCQADGFLALAEKKNMRDRILICDMVCHGVPSTKIWKEYMCLLEKKYGKIKYISFRDKRNGWEKPYAFAKTEEKEISLKPFKRLYVSNCMMRQSCNVCPYTTIERKSDMTLGDFWHLKERLPQYYDILGTSLVLIHTQKGIEFFEKIKSYLEWFSCEKEDCLQKNLLSPTPVSDKREKFMKLYKKGGIELLLKRFGRKSIFRALVSAIKKRK